MLKSFFFQAYLFYLSVPVVMFHRQPAMFAGPTGGPKVRVPGFLASLWSFSFWLWLLLFCSRFCMLYFIFYLFVLVRRCSVFVSRLCLACCCCSYLHRVWWSFVVFPFLLCGRCLHFVVVDRCCSVFRICFIVYFPFPLFVDLVSLFFYTSLFVARCSLFVCFRLLLICWSLVFVVSFYLFFFVRCRLLSFVGYLLIVWFCCSCLFCFFLVRCLFCCCSSFLFYTPLPSVFHPFLSHPLLHLIARSLSQRIPRSIALFLSACYCG